MTAHEHNTRGFPPGSCTCDNQPDFRCLDCGEYFNTELEINNHIDFQHNAAYGLRGDE